MGRAQQLIRDLSWLVGNKRFAGRRLSLIVSDRRLSLITYIYIYSLHMQFVTLTPLHLLICLFLSNVICSLLII